jgi:hypothetical protein
LALSEVNMGLLDNFGSNLDDPKTQAMLALGLGLLNSRGNFGQGLGQAGQQALGAYGDARKAQQQQQMQQQAMQSHALQQQMLQQQLQDSQRAAAEREKLSQLAASSMITPQQGAMAANGGPTNAAAGAIGNTAPGFDWAKYSSGLAGINPMQALQVQAAMKKEQPKLSKLEPMKLPDGQMVNIAVFEDGTTKVLPYGVRPDIALQSLGDKVVAIDKNATPSGQSFKMGATPDTLMQVGATIRGQNVTAGTAAAKLAQDDRHFVAGQDAASPVEYKQDANGDWMALPKKPSLTGAPIQPVQVAAPNKNARAAKAALAIIDQAESLLDSATGSYLGTGVDIGAQVFGASTKGAQTTAKLKALEGALMMQQPRMEGPQSDKDVSLYRQMAAQIGDPTVPAETKRAALSEIRTMHERYSGATPKQKPQPVVKPGSTIKFDANGMMVLE